MTRSIRLLALAILALLSTGRAVAGPPTSCGGAFVGDPEACVDHFFCYDLKRQQFPKQTVHVVDQFGTQQEQVVGPSELCNPASKDDGSPGAPSHPGHLSGFRVRAPRVASHRGVTLTNQFGTILVDTGAPDLLYVPAATDPTAPPPPLPPGGALDHFNCYRARLTFRGSRTRLTGILRKGVST